MFATVRDKVLLAAANSELSFDQFVQQIQASTPSRTFSAHPTSTAFAQVQFVMSPSLRSASTLSVCLVGF
jgi:hypothetical protein